MSLSRRFFGVCRRTDRPTFLPQLLLLPLLTSLMLSNVVVAQPDQALSAAEHQLQSQHWLDRMSRSFRELNYRGTLSFQQGDRMTSLRIAHAVIDGEEYEFIEHMDGARRPVVRKGHSVDCVHPGHQMVRFYQQRLQGKQQQGELAQHYRFRIAGIDRVADRAAVVMLVSPNDAHRFGYRLSLDQQTGLLLRSELVAPGNRVVERFQFVEIIFDEAIPKSFFQQADGSYQPAHTTPHSMTAEQPLRLPKLNWRVAWLPEGFLTAGAEVAAKVPEEVGGEAESAEAQPAKADMMTFTDGLSIFSVFVEPEVISEELASAVVGPQNKFSTNLEGMAQRGATTAYTRALLLGDEPHRVTVVGEIPPRTARQIAQSIIPYNP